MNPKTHNDALRPSDPDGDEARLRALFDVSVEPANGPTLTKLAARAADVPERARRTPLWLPRWAWRPGVAGLVVAGGALSAAWFNMPVDPPAPIELPAVSAQLPNAPEPATSVSLDRSAAARNAVVAPVEIEDDFEPLDLVTAEMDWQLDADEDDALDPLYDPPSDANLDAWLYATTAVLEGGG